MKVDLIRVTTYIGDGNGLFHLLLNKVKLSVFRDVSVSTT